MTKEKLLMLREILIDIAVNKPTGPESDPLSRAMSMLKFCDDKSREGLGIVGELLSALTEGET